MSKVVRILFAIPNFNTAGSGREMFNIIEQLDGQIFEAIITVESEGGNLYSEIVGKGYKIVLGNHNVVKGNNIIEKVMEAVKLGMYFRRYKIDIWQSFHWSSNYFEPIIAKVAGAKYVYVKKNMNWSRSWWIKSLLSGHIVARNTTLMNKYFNSYLFKYKTTHITGAVDLNKFKQTAATSLYRKSIHESESIKIISCIAQIMPIKNQLLLVKATHELENVVLFLAGSERDENYSSEIKQYISSHGLEEKIFLLGNVTDTVALLNETDVFVLPTSKLYGHEEGCPVSLLEAMACGVTCIASNVAGSTDLLQDGMNGYVFENDDLQSLKDKICDAITHPLNAQKNMNLYDLNIESGKFQDAYIKLVK